MTLIYDQPEFSPEQIAEIRRLADEKWTQLHDLKNATFGRAVRDEFSERMRLIESIQEML